MKSFYNKINVIITVFFVLGILFSAFNLYNLPSELEKVSGRIDLTVIKELSPLLNQTNFIVGLTLVLGLSSIILALYLLNFNKTAEKIIYVEKDGTSEGWRYVEPYSFSHDHGEDGLYAWDVSKDGIRRFSIDRISDAEIAEDSFSPRYEIEI